MNGLVSIITPTFNASKYIAEVYASLLAQSHPDWEWLVTDDYSSDDTLKILYEISLNDIRVKVDCNSTNLGAAVTRNKSISRARGEYIAFLDSDDIWLPEKLKKQICFMGDSISFSFTAYEVISTDGKKMGKTVDAHHAVPLTYTDMLKKKATLGCSTVMLRRKDISDLTMPLLRTGQDYALWLKILKSGVQAYALTDTLTLYRIVAGSISRNKFKKALRQWEIYRRIEKLSFFYAIWCFGFYAWRAVFRR